MEKILVIDDQADVRDNMAELLRLEGYNVYEACDGETGIVLAKEILPDLIVCDVQMPNKGGFEVFRHLEADSATNSIPFIFLSGMADTNTRCKGIDAGADDFLIKPICTETLLSTIKCRIKKGKNLKTIRLEHSQNLEMIIHQFSHIVRSPLCTLLGMINLMELENKGAKDEIKFILSGIKSSATKFDDCTANIIHELELILNKNKND